MPAATPKKTALKTVATKPLLRATTAKKVVASKPRNAKTAPEAAPEKAKSSSKKTSVVAKLVTEKAAPTTKKTAPKPTKNTPRVPKPALEKTPVRAKAKPAPQKKAASVTPKIPAKPTTQRSTAKKATAAPAPKSLTSTRSKPNVAEVMAKAPRKTKRHKRKTTATRLEKTPSIAKEPRRNVGKMQPKAAAKPVVQKDDVALVKAKRMRVPKDLAAQYGESEKQKRVVENSETKRARRDAALRQKMRDAMEVDDDLIARLRRAGMIGGSEAESQNGHSTRGIAGSRVMRRPRKWEARCGKCGGKSLFKTQAGLCAKCGAIMVRE